MNLKYGMRVKGLRNDYVITNSGMLEGVIISTDKYNMKIKVLKHEYPAYEGRIYGVSSILDDEFEIIKKEPKKQQFRKKDLRKGDLITLRRGKIYDYSDCEFQYLLKSLNDDLTNAGAMGKPLDVVKVERPIEYKTVFERKEEKKEILDKTEKRYLAGVIRPFRNKVEFIVKKVSHDKKREYLRIVIGEDFINLPWFEIDTMYKGMEGNKRYSLKELGL